MVIRTSRMNVIKIMTVQGTCFIRIKPHGDRRDAIAVARVTLDI